MDKENKCEERQVQKRQNRMKENKSPNRISWEEERKNIIKGKEEVEHVPFQVAACSVGENKRKDDGRN